MLLSKKHFICLFPLVSLSAIVLAGKFSLISCILNDDNGRDIGMIAVSFVNMKGGVGKTTLAVNVADFLSKRNSLRVLVIDVDPQFNATQCLISGKEYIKYLENEGSTVIDIFNYSKASASVVDGKTKKNSKAYAEIVPYTSARGFDVIPSQLDLFRFEMAPGQGTEYRLKNYLAYLKEQDSYDICIIDCPPTPSVWMTSAILASDYYLIPSKPDPISMTGLDLLEGIIKERKENYGCTCKCAGLVLTAVEKHLTVYKDAVAYFSRSPQWNSYLYEPVMIKRTEVAKGQLKGRFIIDIDDSDLKSGFASVVNEFLRRIGM